MCINRINMMKFNMFGKHQFLNTKIQCDPNITPTFSLDKQRRICGFRERGRTHQWSINAKTCVKRLKAVQPSPLPSLHTQAKYRGIVVTLRNHWIYRVSLYRAHKHGTMAERVTGSRRKSVFKGYLQWPFNRPQLHSLLTDFHTWYHSIGKKLTKSWLVFQL